MVLMQAFGNQYNVSANVTDSYGAAQQAGDTFYASLAQFVGGLSQDESGGIQLPDGTYIENISSITGITQFSTWIQVHSAMFELVNKTLQLTVTFEKQIASTASS